MDDHDVFVGPAHDVDVDLVRKITVRRIRGVKIYTMFVNLINFVVQYIVLCCFADHKSSVHNYIHIVVNKARGKAISYRGSYMIYLWVGDNYSSSAVAATSEAIASQQHDSPAAAAHHTMQRLDTAIISHQSIEACLA